MYITQMPRPLPLRNTGTLLTIKIFIKTKIKTIHRNEIIFLQVFSKDFYSVDI